MHTSMRRTLITGGLLAVFAALLAQFGGILGLDEIRSALLGAAIGAALGLVPGNDSSYARVVGFTVGFVLAWIGYALRAGVLPDTGSGRGIAAFLVIIILTGVCAATMGWMPLWAGLLGIAAIASSVGFLVGAVGSAFVGEEGDHGRSAAEALGTGPTTHTGDNAGVQILDKPAEA